MFIVVNPPYCFLLNLTTDEEVEVQSDFPEAFKVNVQRNREGLYATDPTYAHKTGETLHMGLLSITMQREGTRSTALHTNSPLNVRHKQDGIYGRDPGCYLKHSIPQIVTKPPHLKSSLWIDWISAPRTLHSAPQSNFSLTIEQALYKWSATAGFRNILFPGCLRTLSGDGLWYWWKVHANIHVLQCLHLKKNVNHTLSSLRWVIRCSKQHPIFYSVCMYMR